LIHHHDESVFFKYHNGLWYDFNGFNSSKPYPCNPVGSTHKLHGLFKDLVADIFSRQNLFENFDDEYFNFDIIRYGGRSARQIPNSCIIVKKGKRSNKNEKNAKN
jgi:hypothetical protein